MPAFSWEYRVSIRYHILETLRHMLSSPTSPPAARGLSFGEVPGLFPAGGPLNPLPGPALDGLRLLVGHPGREITST